MTYRKQLVAFHFFPHVGLHRALTHFPEDKKKWIKESTTNLYVTSDGVVAWLVDDCCAAVSHVISHNFCVGSICVALIWKPHYFPFPQLLCLNNWTQRWWMYQYSNIGKRPICPIYITVFDIQLIFRGEKLFLCNKMLICHYMFLEFNIL